MNRLVAIESPMRPVASFVASRNSASPGATASSISRSIEPRGKREVGIAREAGGHHQRGVDERLGDALLHLGELLVADAGQDVAARAPASPRRRRCASRGSAPGVSAMRTCETTAPFFCARPVMSSTLHALAFEVRGHAEQRADRDHAGAADAGDQDAVGLGVVGDARDRAASGNSPASRLLRLAQRAAFDGDEARAEALDAGVVLVARALVDRALAAELGLDRRDRHAVRLDAAVAAALADELVDDDALRRIGILAALAAAALLGGAGLVVEQHRAARRVAQLALHGVEVVAVVDLDVAGEVAGRILVRLVGDDDDLRHAFGGAPAARCRAGEIGPSTGWPPVIATASL